MATVILLLVAAPYAAVAVAYLEARRHGEMPPRWSRVVGVLTVVAHLSALVALGAQTGRSPFHTESQSLAFLAFSLAALYVVLEATSGVATHGGGFWLLTAILSASAVPGLSHETGAAATGARLDAVVSLHIGFALLGTANIAAGGLLAFGYLGAYRRAKSGAIVPGGDGQPSLFGLQVLAKHASAVGLLLLGPSLVLGIQAAMAADFVGLGAVLEIAVSALQFVVVAAAAFLWWRRPLRGAVAAWLNVAATCLAIASFAVVHPLLMRGAGS